MSNQGDSRFAGVRTESHDPGVSGVFLSSCGPVWRDEPLDGRPRARRAANTPTAGRHCPRCSLARRWSSPPARRRYGPTTPSIPFRPGSDFAYLTGDHDPDSVLVLRPNGSGHDATLTCGPRRPATTTSSSAAGTASCGSAAGTRSPRSRPNWASRPPPRRPAAALADLAPGRTRVLRGLDPRVDAAPCAPDEPERAGRPGPRAGDGDLRAQAGQG